MDLAHLLSTRIVKNVGQAPFFLKHQNIVVFFLLGFQLSCSGIGALPRLDEDVSISVVDIADDKLHIKLMNGRSTPIYINQQPGRDSVPAFIGARVVCQEGGENVDHGDRTDAPLKILPIEAGVEKEFTLWIFKPLPHSRENCEILTRYFDNAHAVELVYKSTSPPNEITTQELEFIEKSTKYLSVKINNDTVSP